MLNIGSDGSKMGDGYGVNSFLGGHSHAQINTHESHENSMLE